jgi:hypothetical protein
MTPILALALIRSLILAVLQPAIVSHDDEAPITTARSHQALWRFGGCRPCSVAASAQGDEDDQQQPHLQPV